MNSPNYKSSLSKKIAEFIVTNRFVLAVLAIIITCSFATGILRTNFDASLSALLTESDPYLEELDLMQKAFPSNGEIRFAFVANTGSTIFNRSTLNAISDLKEKFTVIPKTRGITTILEFISPETQKRLFIKSLDKYTASELSDLGNAATTDRLLTTNLLSQSGALTFAIINVDTQSASNLERFEIADAIISLQEELRISNPNVNLFANAEVLLEQSSQQDMLDDLTRLMPLVILLCVLVICFCFRSFTIGACILSHVGFTIVSTVGALGYLNFAFNNISVIAPLVVVIISVANSVHIISVFKQALNRGLSEEEAVTFSMACNLQPISLAALTTAIGFSSLNMSSSPAIEDFGQIVSLGIVFAYALTLLMLPALLTLITTQGPGRSKTNVSFLQPQLEKVINFTSQHDRNIFVSCSFLALVTLLLLPLNETDFNRLDFIASDSDISEYYDAVSENMNRGLSLAYGIDTKIREGAINPFFLKKVDAFTEWVANQQNVESVISLAEVLKTINRIVSEDKKDTFRIPEDIETNKNYLNAYRTVEANYLPLASFINDDNSIISFVVNASSMSNQEMIDLDSVITENFSKIFSSANLIHGSGVLLFARMDELVTIELLQGYSISLLLITLCLIFGFKSIYFGLLSVIPNLLPATMVFGFWALLVGQLDPFVMMLFSISIGLVVDDTVHILSHYLESRREGRSKDVAIAYSIKVAGPALTITTLVLALGTTVLIFANTIYFQQSAKLLVPIVILALILDLLYLPSILKRFDNRFRTQEVMTS